MKFLNSMTFQVFHDLYEDLGRICCILLLTLSKSLSVELNDGCVNNTSISPLEVAPDDIGKIDM